MKNCGKQKMLDAIKLPPPELYNLVEVCYKSSQGDCHSCFQRLQLIFLSILNLNDIFVTVSFLSL